jgi:hypothetical protein
MSWLQSVLIWPGIKQKRIKDYFGGLQHTLKETKHQIIVADTYILTPKLHARECFIQGLNICVTSLFLFMREGMIQTNCIHAGRGYLKRKDRTKVEHRFWVEIWCTIPSLHSIYCRRKKIRLRTEQVKICLVVTFFQGRLFGNTACSSLKISYLLLMFINIGSLQQRILFPKEGTTRYLLT